jgi:hypothetical protein
LYPAVVDQVEVEKFAKNPNVKRLNIEKLVSGILSDFIRASEKVASEFKVKQ